MAAAARFHGRRNQADVAEAAVVEEKPVGQPPTVQAHAAADMAIEDGPSEQQPAVQISNPASDGPIIKQEETEPATKLEDVPATDASQEVSSRMAELETQIQQVAASLSSNRASGIADQLAQLVGEYHSLTLIQEIGADDEERLDAKGPGSSSSLCKVMSCGFGIEVGR
jgi:multidrug efflux pump subunit AcrB